MDAVYSQHHPIPRQARGSEAAVDVVGVDPEELIRIRETMMMTVEDFARAISKSPRTVYRMALEGQLFVFREGAGRGTVLIYRDQLDPANRPEAARDKRPQRRSPWNAAR